ncbi:uncharacterized protein LOC143033923 [Oratosquilla oratoria]|uniref:uncharacterized protein LOC143033923 n=1 Tax=Oratosquilla oratoria TaxID=337810 RepID=UPI003F776680
MALESWACHTKDLTSNTPHTPSRTTTSTTPSTTPTPGASTDISNRTMGSRPEGLTSFFFRTRTPTGALYCLKPASMSKTRTNRDHACTGHHSEEELIRMEETTRNHMTYTRHFHVDDHLSFLSIKLSNLPLKQPIPFVNHSTSRPTHGDVYLPYIVV